MRDPTIKELCWTFFPYGHGYWGRHMGGLFFTVTPFMGRDRDKYGYPIGPYLTFYSIESTDGRSSRPLTFYSSHCRELAYAMATAERWAKS